MERRNQLGAAKVEHPSAQPRNRLLGLEQRAGGEGAERDDDLRLNRGQLAKQERLAGRDFVGLRVPVARRPAFSTFAMYTSSRREPHRVIILVRSWPARPTNGHPLLVLVGAGRLPDEHDFSGHAAGAEYYLPAAERVQLAPRALADVIADGGQRFRSRTRHHQRDRSRNRSGFGYASAVWASGSRCADVIISRRRHR